jgi:hypothetical protein
VRRARLLVGSCSSITLCGGFGGFIHHILDAGAPALSTTPDHAKCKLSSHSSLLLCLSPIKVGAHIVCLHQSKEGPQHAQRHHTQVTCAPRHLLYILEDDKCLVICQAHLTQKEERTSSGCRKVPLGLCGGHVHEEVAALRVLELHPVGRQLGACASRCKQRACATVG